MSRKLYIVIVLLLSQFGPIVSAQELKVISYNIHHGADKEEN